MLAQLQGTVLNLQFTCSMFTGPRMNQLAAYAVISSITTDTHIDI